MRELENDLHRHIEYKHQYYKQLHEFNSKEPREPKEQLPRARENQQEIQGTIQEDLQEIKRQIRKNLTESLAKKTLIPILTSIGGAVIMGVLILLYHNITVPPTKEQLGYSLKMRKIKEELEQENKVLKEFYLQHKNEN
ncbi:hypothetical protein [Helicobacter pylori]|uniref:hypothetical protein n=1 Tax=Helicobacter pylori TaxID=210 RepID=UPI0035A72C66